MLNAVKNWWEERIIRRSTITESEWQQAFNRLPLLDRLTAEDKNRLKRLAILFLDRKSLEGAGDLELVTQLKLVVALQACLPILNLGLDWYDGWYSVVVHPAGFAPLRTEMDEFGVVHRVKESLSGESWQRGPVVLSADEAWQSGKIDGHNLIVHEFAHKLDMQNGVANGMPPLHKGMSAQYWSESFSQAYADLQSRLDQGKPIAIDRYAATAPAEFFAVVSEVFFEQPAIIQRHYPAVHEQLKQFYRQDPQAP